MKILAIETATEACSAAVLVGDDVAERYQVAPRGHADLILTMVQAVLGEAGLSLAQLDGIAFGRGPGSFTGVRIATGVVQGLAFGADLPVAPVSTLAAVAQGTYRVRGATQLLVALDARMHEVYWGCYGIVDGLARLEGTEQVVAPAQTPLPVAGQWWGAGSGWQAHADVLLARHGAHLAGRDEARLPHAADVARLGAVLLQGGGGVAAEQALPVYLRDRVVQSPREA